MYNVINFVNWLKMHTKNGTEPWVYLMGTSGHKVTQMLLDAKYRYIYSKKMTRKKFDALTAGWIQNNRTATDCQGLADAYFTQVLGVPTEVLSNTNYIEWCTHKGSVKEIDRPYIPGEAVFMAHANGHVHHVGWVCDFDSDGEPLVIEARGIKYGVVTTRLCDRKWTHRGIMTKKFRYEGVEDMKTIFHLKSPMMKGTDVKALQIMLNEAGYSDPAGEELNTDGKFGKKSLYALTEFIKAHELLLPKPEDAPAEPACIMPEELGITQEINGVLYSGTLAKKKD